MAKKIQDGNQIVTNVDSNDNLTFSIKSSFIDSTPTANSTNLVTSGGVKSALDINTTDIAAAVVRIANNETNISNNTTNIGTLSNLTTTSKTNLVSAINELETDKLKTSAIVNEASTEIDEVYSSDYLNDKLVSVGATAPTDGRRVWFSKSKNLFNIQTIVKGRLANGVISYVANVTNLTLNQNSFSFTTDANNRGVSSDFILVDKTSYVFKGETTSNYTLDCACYNSSKTWLRNATTSVENGATKITLNSDVAYIRLYFNLGTAGTMTINNPQLEEGSTASTYEPYVEKTINIDDEKFIGQEELVSVGANQPTDGRRVWFKKGKNLFDGQLELGSYGSSGEKIDTTNTYRNINAISVSPNTTYTFSINGVTQKYVVLFYDVNKNYISQNSSLTTGTFTTPNNTYFVNFRSFVADFVSDFANLKVQLEEGSTATSYEAYNRTINVDGDEIYNLQFQTPQKITLSFNTTYVYETDLDYTCFKLGKLAFLFINTLAFKVGKLADFPNYSVIVSGLPRPSQTKIFYLQPSGNFNRFRVGVTSTGNMQRHWSPDPSYGDTQNKQYSGFIVYETTD